MFASASFDCMDGVWRLDLAACNCACLRIRAAGWAAGLMRAHFESREAPICGVDVSAPRLQKQLEACLRALMLHGCQLLL